MKLIKDMQREPFRGIGKPEPLRGDLSRLAGRDGSPATTVLMYRVVGCSATSSGSRSSRVATVIPAEAES